MRLVGYVLDHMIIGFLTMALHNTMNSWVSFFGESEMFSRESKALLVAVALLENMSLDRKSVV